MGSRPGRARAVPSAKKPALRKPMPVGTEKGVVWVEPRFVGEVEFRDWTQDELIRQASFKGLREDKTPEECVLEKPKG